MWNLAGVKMCWTLRYNYQVILVLALGALFGRADVGASEKTRNPELQCSQETTDSEAMLKCTLKNNTKDHLLLLTTPVALQGAMPGQSGYFHVPSGGDRKENVLEYVPHDKSWPGILGHPFRYIKHSELRSLNVVASGSLTHVKINWSAGGQVSRSFGGLRARVKLAFLRLDGREVAWRNAIRTVCRVQPPPQLTFRKSTWIDLSTVRHSGFEKIREDRCGEAISTPFEDIYSSDFFVRQARH